MSWFPLFEFQKWSYQSYLILPTSTEIDSPPGASVSSRKWAKGLFQCGQAFNADQGDGYTLDGKLVFREGVELDVQVRGITGSEDQAGTFEAIGTGTHGPTNGAIYKLSGWVFPTLPMSVPNASRPHRIKGAVWAVRGPNTNPLLELGGLPVGTVGVFEIVCLGDA